ncbi:MULTISPECIES: nucleoid-associated protein [unclassified Methylobacterium]|jgi:37-kD nucleoid-associated bacterial protein|uniref:nucleoid-associated protein n=1 Tax=unclassified Methylobacterium TaxID=2615210 RepID=UPI0013532AD7|nr:nucleoid-associated protein [Methylobacterium sp. 2A]MWV24691.1 nucleoid-associated protein [Methylobacterium sp. 2A]
MAFLTDAEKDALSIRRMIFHVVGKDLDEPTLLPEITPLQEPAFFLARVRSALTGNLFAFRVGSGVEAALRGIAGGGDFTAGTQALARDFHTRHRSGTSNGAFLVFELGVGTDDPVYALVKYDHDEVVRYSLGAAQPRLERLQEAFVKKPEAMQKIALVRLAPGSGGHVMVRDRSKRTHISEYFEGFLNARRVNEPGDLSGKLVEAVKVAYKTHKPDLPADVQAGGVNRLYDVLRQGGQRYDPEDREPLLTALFGVLPEGASIRGTLERQLRDRGVAEESFEIDPERVQKPRKRVMETQEGVLVLYDEAHRPTRTTMPDGRERIEILTAGVLRDDVDTENRSRGR